jgi:aspartyl protease family protein
MWRYIFMAVSFFGFASLAPALLQEKIAEKPAASAEAKPQMIAAKVETPRQGDNPGGGRSTRITADGRGHFVAMARLNGRSAEVLVDTGATTVAINESMARRIGVKLAKADFKYKVRTANGETLAAGIVIDEIEIGRVRAENVEAAVLEDDALDGILLGMSFLGKLKRFEVENGSLVLTQ